MIVKHSVRDFIINEGEGGSQKKINYGGSSPAPKNIVGHGPLLKNYLWWSLIMGEGGWPCNSIMGDGESKNVQAHPLP